MPDRKSLVRTLWLLALLASPAWIVVAPPHESEVVANSPRHDNYCVRFARPQVQPAARLRAGIGDDDALDVGALAWEDEEQDRVDALGEPRPSFLVAHRFRNVPDRPLIDPPSTRSHYPIRC